MAAAHAGHGSYQTDNGLISTYLAGETCIPNGPKNRALPQLPCSVLYEAQFGTKSGRSRCDPNLAGPFRPKPAEESKIGSDHMRNIRTSVRDLSRSFVILVFLLIATIIGVPSYIVTTQWHADAIQATATSDALRLLNNTYGSEVGTQIERFEANWSAMSAYRQPSIQAELATGQFLASFGFASEGQALYDQPSGSLRSLLLLGT